jgi:hypothetical protein
MAATTAWTAARDTTRDKSDTATAGSSGSTRWNTSSTTASGPRHARSANGRSGPSGRAKNAEVRLVAAIDAGLLHPICRGARAVRVGVCAIPGATCAGGSHAVARRRRAFWSRFLP